MVDSPVIPKNEPVSREESKTVAVMVYFTRREVGLLRDAIGATGEHLATWVQRISVLNACELIEVRQSLFAAEERWLAPGTP